jgi:hypothetical protein
LAKRFLGAAGSKESAGKTFPMKSERKAARDWAREVLRKHYGNHRHTIVHTPASIPRFHYTVALRTKTTATLCFENVVCRNAKALRRSCPKHANAREGRTPTTVDALERWDHFPVRGNNSTSRCAYGTFKERIGRSVTPSTRNEYFKTVYFFRIVFISFRKYHPSCR